MALVIIHTPSNRLVILLNGLAANQSERDEHVAALIQSHEQLSPDEQDRLSTFLFTSGTPSEREAFAKRMNQPGSHLERTESIEFAD